jgi:hypothetical protein
MLVQTGLWRIQWDNSRRCWYKLVYGEWIDLILLKSKLDIINFCFSSHQRRDPIRLWKTILLEVWHCFDFCFLIHYIGTVGTITWFACSYRFLESLMSPDVEYTVAITAFWAIEAVYQTSFALCLEDGSKTPAELRETCQRWGNDGFGQYCNSLKKIANRRLEKASDDVLSAAEVALLRVLELEVEFWNMSRGDA